MVQTKKLLLATEGGQHPAWLCLVHDKGSLSIDSTLLHEREKEYFSQISSQKRASSYLMGRYAAKEAFKQAVPGAGPFRETAILNGVFGQPVMDSKLSHCYQVSISHCQGLGAALLFPETHPMGMDIERAQRGSQAMEKRMTQKELSIVKQSLTEEEVKTAPMCFWTIKESLTKFLKIGLTVDLSLLEVHSMEKKGRYYEAEFTHFPHCKALSWRMGEFIISLSLPKKTEAHLAQV